MLTTSTGGFFMSGKGKTNGKYHTHHQVRMLFFMERKRVDHGGTDLPDRSKGREQEQHDQDTG